MSTVFLDTPAPAVALENDPFAFQTIFLKELDGPMTLSETIELEKGKVLIFRKEARKDDAYAFVVCWDKRLDWASFEGIYSLYEERTSALVHGNPSCLEPVFIAKSIDNDVLKFIQEQSSSSPAANALHRAFTF